MAKRDRTVTSVITVIGRLGETSGPQRQLHSAALRRQSHRMSMIEAVTNVVVGYALAVGTQVLVFPLIGLTASFSDNLLIGAVFTSVSVIRSYALRRMFERWRES